jgi:hypothetical protein
LLYVFWGCLAFGILFSIGSFILGGHGAGHGGMDHGGDATDMPSPLNPLVIASAITTFGAAGLVGKAGFAMSDLSSSALGLLFAGTIGAAMFFGVVKLMYSSQSDSTFSLEALVGTEAEVTTPVPEKGMGEISCIVNGVRYGMPAQSSCGEVARGEVVRIQEIKGNIAFIARKMTLEDLEQLEYEQRESGEKEKNE